MGNGNGIRFIIDFFFKPGPQFSLKKMGLILFFSTFAISGSTSITYLFYRYTKHLKSAYDADVIEAIVQTTSQDGPNHASLQTAYLAEVLELSADLPTNLSTFDLGEAKKMLLKTGIIKEAKLKKIKPNLLYIHYSTRVPFAYLDDFTNTAIDEEGFFFPFSPFYLPRRLPHVYVGKKKTLLLPQPLKNGNISCSKTSDQAGEISHQLKSHSSGCIPWGEHLETNSMNFLYAIIKFLKSEEIEKIDISQVCASSSGRREIVVALKDGIILRLNPKTYTQQLSHYFILKRDFLKKNHPVIIDLRIPEVAYIQNL